MRQQNNPMRARFVLALVVALVLSWFHNGVDYNQLRPRCHLTVSWASEFDTVVPKALDQLAGSTGLTWSQAQDGAYITVTDGVLAVDVLGETSTYRLYNRIRRANVVVDLSKPNSDLYGTVLHELAHAIGIQHSDEYGSYMYPYQDAGQTVTVTDAAQLAATGGRCY